MENLNEHYSEVWEKAGAYDKLDQKLRLVCNLGPQELLIHIAQYGLAHKKITEQQALNKIAERFPMTPEQISEMLERSLITKVPIGKIKVPKCMGEFLDGYADLNETSLMHTMQEFTESPYFTEFSRFPFGRYPRWDHLLVDAIRCGYVAEPEWVIKGDRGYLASISISRGSATGWTAHIDEALTFTDKKKAKAVAYLSNGKAVPASVGIKEEEND